MTDDTSPLPPVPGLNQGDVDTLVGSIGAQHLQAVWGLTLERDLARRECDAREEQLRAAIEAQEQLLAENGRLNRELASLQARPREEATPSKSIDEGVDVSDRTEDGLVHGAGHSPDSGPGHRPNSGPRGPLPTTPPVVTPPSAAGVGRARKDYRPKQGG